jgi:hypothetical protein
MSDGIFVTLEGLEGARTELRASQLQELLANCGRKTRLIEHVTLSDGQEANPNAIVHFLSEASALYTKALALDYDLRYHEAYETYAEMQRKWGREQKVRALAQLFTR